MTERVAYRVDYGTILDLQIVEAGIEPAIPEYSFHPTRRFRFDRAWPGHKLAVEIDGGIWVRGRHVRGAGYRRDCIKGNEALILGWRVLHFTPDMVTDGSAIQYIEYAMRGTK